MATVFISYNRQSESVTKALADDIEALGHRVWFDKDVSGGQSWWNLILDKIRQSEVFVFVLDAEALNSTACKREYEYAAELGKSILPILASIEVSTNLLPPALSKIQFVDYRKTDREAAFRLARAFTTIPPPTVLPDPLPTPPEAPISYLGNLAEQVDTISTLNYEKQCAILLDLRRGLRDPNTANDVKILLKRFRKRKDLLLTVAEDIDELIKDKLGAASPVSEPEETTPTRPVQTPPQVEIERDRPISTSAVAHSKPSPQERFLGAIILGSFIVIFNVVFFEWYDSFLNHINSRYAYGFFILVIGGIVAGLICGKRRWGLIIALVGSIPANILNLYNANNGIIGSILIIAASIIGVQISKRKSYNYEVSKPRENE